MLRERWVQGQVSAGMIVTATVLLLGVLLVAYGYYRPSHVGLYAGLAVTLLGVLGGTMQIVVSPRR